jgi:tetratricopeptide (TPR) repeat protein
VQVVFLMHGGYAYFSSPIKSAVGKVSVSEIFNQQNALMNTLKELYLSLLQKDVKPEERGHILHNIGSAYYDLHKIIPQDPLLDSSENYYQQSIRIISNNARFYYNLGRLYTEYRKHDLAKQNYEKALGVKPDHILALHNLALLNYFELNNREVAKALLSRVLSIQARSPVCNYVLGEIFEKENNINKAIFHYNKEIETFYSFIRSKTNIPVSSYTLKLSLMKSHYQLFLLYSTERRDKELAKKNLDAYLIIEKNEEERKRVIKEFNNYW